MRRAPYRQRASPAGASARPIVPARGRSALPDPGRRGSDCGGDHRWDHPLDDPSAQRDDAGTTRTAGADERPIALHGRPRYRSRVPKPILRDLPESFETDRLILRAPAPGDGAELCAAVSESLAELRPWLPWAKEPPTAEGYEEFAREGRARFLMREELRFQLYLRSETSTLVGSSGLHRMDWEAGRFEIGYWIRTRFAGQGYMTEAVRGLAWFAFRELDANRLEIWCDARNERSAQVARRVGFVHEGTFVDHTRANDGSLATGLCFRMLRAGAGETLGAATAASATLAPTVAG